MKKGKQNNGPRQGQDKLRRQAEERLRATPENEVSALATEDLARLLHELQVNQVELEIQNEELEESRRATESALEQYTDLYDFAPVGYFTLDRDGVIRRSSLAGATILGIQRSRLLDRQLGSLVSEESQPAFNVFLGEMLEGASNAACDVALLGDEQTPRYVHLNGAMVKRDKDEGLLFRIAMTDITERKQAEAELEEYRFHLEALVKERTSLLEAANAELQAEILERKAAEVALERERANLQAVFDMVNVGMLLIDEAGGVKRINNTLARWLGGALPDPRGGQPGDFLGCIHALTDPAGCGQTSHCASCRIRNTFVSVFRTGQPVHSVETEAGFSVGGKRERLWLEVSADLLDLDGKRHVVLAMNNITLRKQAQEERERLLKEVERHAAETESIFDAQQDAVLVFDTEMNVRRANPSFLELYGYDPAGLNIQDMIRRLRARRADGRPMVPDELPTTRALRGNKVTGEVFMVTHGGGAETIIEVSSSPIRTGDHITGSIAVWHDIGERVKHDNELRKLNRTLRANSHSNQAMMRAKNESDYLNEVCKIVVEDCGHAMLWIGFAEHDEAKSVRPVASAGFEDGYLDTLQVTWADTERGRGPTGTAIRTGKPCGCRNMQTDPRFEPWREEALRRGYASSLALPLLSGEKVFGAITVYAREVDAFGEEETKLLAELAEDLVFGIRTLRMRDAHKQTAELLGRSEDRYRTLFNGMTEGFALHQIILDENGVPRDYRFLEVNPAFERLTGLRAIDILGRTLTEVLPDDSPHWVEIYGRVALSGEALHFEDYSAPLERWYEIFAYSPAPMQFAVIFMDITIRKQAEARVAGHVEELKAMNEELARFNRVAVGRELRMVELKKHVNELCIQAGQPPPYPLEFEKEE